MLIDSKGFSKERNIQEVTISKPQNTLKPNYYAFNSSSVKAKKIQKLKLTQRESFIKQEQELLEIKHQILKEEYLNSKENKFQKFLLEKRFKYREELSHLGPGVYFKDSNTTNTNVNKLKEIETLKNKKGIKNNKRFKKDIPVPKPQQKVKLPKLRKEEKEINSSTLCKKRIKNVLNWNHQAKRTISLSILENKKIALCSDNMRKGFVKNPIVAKNKLITTSKRLNPHLDGNIKGKEFSTNPIPGPGYYKVKECFQSTSKKKKNSSFLTVVLNASITDLIIHASAK